MKSKVEVCVRKCARPRKLEERTGICVRYFGPGKVAASALGCRARARPLSLLTRFSRQLDRVSWRFNANRTGPVPVPRGFGGPSEPSCALVHNQSCSSHASSPPLSSIVPAIFTAAAAPAGGGKTDPNCYCHCFYSRCQEQEPVSDRKWVA